MATPMDATLDSASNAIDAGRSLPNVNDSFVGIGADIGALEKGDKLPTYGPRDGQSLPGHRPNAPTDLVAE